MSERVRRKYWDDFKVGHKLTTSSITVTETHVVNFGSLTGDFYPLHMDEEYARTTQYGGRIAHGPLTFCLAVGLVGQTGIFDDSLIAFLGAKEFRLLKPVMLGDTIHVLVEVDESRPSSNPASGLVTMGYHVLNQRGEEILTAQMQFLMHRRIFGDKIANI